MIKTAPNKRKPAFPTLKRMDDGGPTAWQSANQWATNNQAGISSAAGFGAATIDAFAPTDAYGVRSNGAALGSGALSGAGKGAAIGSAFGPEGTLIGGAAGAVVGGVEGILGNKSANMKKTQAIQTSTTAQLANDRQMASARDAGNPNLRYGNMNASYYRFGGVMKNSPATLPRTTQPLPAVQGKPRLMPNITESPNRMLSKRAYGGMTGNNSGGVMAPQIPNALRYSATKLFRPDKSLKAQKNQILATGGTIHKQGHTKPHFLAKGQPQSVQVPQAGTAPQMPSAQPQMDPNQVMQMQQMMQQQQGGMQQHADGGSIHINPANKGKFNATKAATGKSTEQLTHSSNPVTKKRAIFAQNASHWNKKADGGQVEQLSSQDAAINGPSHENGGVKFPSAGVELEGGETVNNGFVFSKKLGFAKPAEAIARQLGKAEKRPEGLINNSTVSALQRKTELLKAQQEATKQAMGIPNDLEQKAAGGPIMPRDTTRSINPNGQPLFASVNNPGDGYSGGTTLSNGMRVQWTPNLTSKSTSGQSIQILGRPLPPAIQNQREFQMGQPGRTLPNGPSIPEIKSPTGRTYKFGGSMKKMDDGGDPLYPDSAVPYLNVPKFNPATAYNYQGMLNEVNINAPKIASKFPSRPDVSQDIPDIPNLDTPTPPVVGDANAHALFLKGQAQAATAANKPTVASSISKGFAAAAPFLSNYYNATQKLSLPPVPQLNTEITPNLVDYSASRNEAVRQARSANASARTNLNSGAAVSATTAANLAGQVRSVGQINEAENNQNAQIRNSAAAENAQIRTGNTALQNNYQNELVQRQIKSQNMQSANMANAEEKIHGMGIDQKLQDNEHTKLMLTALSDPTGASWRGARGQFAKYLPADQMAQLDAYNKKLSDRYDADNELDRQQKVQNLAAFKSYTDWAKANPNRPASENPMYGIGFTGDKSITTTTGPTGTRTTKKD